MSELENIALFDLDSTLCDYSKAMKKDYNLLKSPNDPEFQDFIDEENPYLKNRKRIIVNQPGWWKNLEPLKIGFDILNVAREIGFSIGILTKAPKHAPNAWTEKSIWVRKHVSDAQILTITQDKGLVYGKVLVDDWPAYIKRWIENRPRGLVIIPAQTWNKEFHHPNAIRYDGTNIEIIKKALEIAKNRNQREPLDLSNL
ncbi:MAG: hypothetical protein KKF48_04195 [Nanoarchaeota archaeon]|nr:hypothetical protein [Nanoarchaeota archaeon]MBU1028220.1 hypothetical protein [Nanoarchaeota archaeon]